MAHTEFRYATKVNICVKRGGNCMKSKREIEQFLTILELQEIMIPFFCPFRKLFVKKWISFIRNYLFESEGEMVNLRELQLTINHVISPKVQYGGLKMWELTWIMGVLDYFYCWE